MYPIGSLVVSKKLAEKVEVSRNVTESGCPVMPAPLSARLGVGAGGVLAGGLLLSACPPFI